ncbi:MAG: cytochrome c1 [Gammaproteobacteria bacterium]|nr:cytochrome c1 [Gammaproteobacteria bacterium]
MTRVLRALAPVLLLALAIGPAAHAAGSGAALTPYKASLRDKHSLQRGARLFVNYCLSCHSARFMRYSRVADDLEIPREVAKRNMLFTGEKIGDPMVAVMTKEDAEAWFGIAPPDLSLVARLRGDDWLYNYFLAFYLDPDAPNGWNNAVYPNTAMPHALHPLQGLQRALPPEEEGGPMRFEKVRAGSMSDAEYARAVGDLTNFLVYMGEPSRPARIRYGVWTFLFLLAFAALAYRLKKEYWRDIHE